MINFITKLIISFVFSTSISILSSFLYLYIGYLIVDYFKLNYNKNGSYWVINLVIVLTIATWIFSFFYCAYRIN